LSSSSLLLQKNFVFIYQIVWIIEHVLKDTKGIRERVDIIVGLFLNRFIYQEALKE
jgi:hypothetical protein